jgi:replicative DNA helicase Mcm
MAKKKPTSTKISDSEKEIINEVWRKAISSANDEFISAQITEQQDKVSVASLKIDLKKLSETQKDEFEIFTKHPAESIDTIKRILTEPFYGFEDVNITVENFNNLEPPLPKKKIRQLRAKDIGKLILFDGLVRTSSGVDPKLNMVAFHCDECGQVVYDVQEGNVLDVSSIECSCHAKGNKLTQMDYSDFDDFMKCSIEEDPEGVRGKQPERLSCEFIGVLTDEGKRVSVGERVTVLGIYKAREKTKGSLLYQGYISVLGAVKKGKNYEELDISPEDEQKFLAMAADKDLLAKMTAAVAPNIAGHEVEKSAVVLQMFSGNLEAGDRRGNIHILIIGDPGVGKSKMIRNIADMAPHVVKASGAPTTTVGLTACVTKDEDTPGGFILDAGAAVLADGGMLVVDEFDKMDKTVRGAMHEIMEDQRTTISKANINTELNTRCSVLAIMNPKRNRFNREEVIADQIDLPQSLLSRFDLIFAIRDIVNEKQDMLKCDAIDRARQGVHPSLEYQREDITRYIIYARSKVKNIIPTPEAIALLHERFKTIRSSNQDDTIPITLRQYDGMLRLAEACAKLRLSNVVEKEDAEIALRIITHYLDSMCLDPGTMKYDINRAVGGETKDQQKARLGLIGFIEANIKMLTENNPNGWINAEELKEAFMKETDTEEKDYKKALKEAQDERYLTLKSNDEFLEFKEKKPRKGVLRDEYKNEE